MFNADKMVFISYRRSVSKYIARAIFADLRLHGYDVFLDVENINGGAFDTIILNQIAARAHFLIVLTAGTLERCVEPGDWLRREIEYAMDLQRNIVPMMIDEFKFDANTPQYLTGKLSVLPRYNSLQLYYDYFDASMERLRDRFLKKPDFSPILQPIPPEQKEEVRQIVEETANEPEPTLEELKAESRFARDLDQQQDGKIDSALADDSEGMSINPELSRTYFSQGLERYEEGDLNAAIENYDQAILLNPHLAEAHNNRGEIYFALGKYRNALIDFKQANVLKPGHDFVLAGIAITYHALEQIYDAKNVWKILVVVDKRYRDADWVKQELNWLDPLAEEARKLIGKLDH